MPRMLFGTNAYRRERGGLPELPVINMFAEAAPSEEKGVMLQSRPGLEAGFAMGSGPVQTLFRGDGVIAGSVFGVSGGALYSGSDLVGALDGSGPFSMAAYEDRVFIAGGGSLWTFGGGVLERVAFPDNANVTKVIVAASRAVTIRADTEQFYWSDPLSTNIDSLSFATAESQPDRLRDMLFVDDRLIQFGAETVEFWPKTTDNGLPFAPLAGYVFPRGIRATGCATKFSTGFAWVTNVNQVCFSTPENVVSDPGLEALIEASATARLQTFFLEGTEFLWLKLDSGDHVYSARSGLWSQFSSYGSAGWDVSCFAGGYFGSATDGDTLAWGDGHVDLGGVLERRFRAGMQVNSAGVVVNNLSLRTNPGGTPYLSGSYVEPTLEMRLSRDLGRTWGNWRSASLGRQGEYRKQVQFIGLGMASRPGFLAEFRVTDPVDFRVSDTLFNEPFGGI